MGDMRRLDSLRYICAALLILKTNTHLNTLRTSRTIATSSKVGPVSLRAQSNAGREDGLAPEKCSVDCLVCACSHNVPMGDMRRLDSRRYICAALLILKTNLTSTRCAHPERSLHRARSGHSH